MIEYRVIDRESGGWMQCEALESVLNEQAAQGWRLSRLDVHPVSRSRGTGELCVLYQFIFERQRTVRRPAKA